MNDSIAIKNTPPPTYAKLRYHHIMKRERERERERETHTHTCNAAQRSMHECLIKRYTRHATRTKHFYHLFLLHAHTHTCTHAHMHARTHAHMHARTLSMQTIACTHTSHSAPAGRGGARSQSPQQQDKTLQ